MKLVVLDRDGVINEDSDNYIKTPDEWIPIPGSLEAIAKLNNAGYRVVIITNQSGLARGLFSPVTLSKMHLKMKNLLSEHGGHIDSILFCPHHPDDKCECRKPRNGLYIELSKRMHIDLKNVISIGDSAKDIRAAQSVGATPILVLTGKGEKEKGKIKDLDSIDLYKDLHEAVNAILKSS